MGSGPKTRQIRLWYILRQRSHSTIFGAGAVSRGRIRHRGACGGGQKLKRRKVEGRTHCCCIQHSGLFAQRGTGSQMGHVDFIGWARADMVAGYGGSANWSVIGKVYDATVGSWIGQVQIFNVNKSNGGMGISGGNYSRSCLVSLQAGHQYVLLVHTEQHVGQYGPFIPSIESGDANYHTRWDQIRLRWQ